MTTKTTTHVFSDVPMTCPSCVATIQKHFQEYFKNDQESRCDVDLPLRQVRFYIADPSLSRKVLEDQLTLIGFESEAPQSSALKEAPHSKVVGFWLFSKHLDHALLFFGLIFFVSAWFHLSSTLWALFQACLSVPLLWAGLRPSFQAARVAGWRGNMHTLVVLGVGAAWLCSCCVLMFPLLSGVGHLYFDVALINLFLIRRVHAYRDRIQKEIRDYLEKDRQRIPSLEGDYFSETGSILKHGILQVDGIAKTSAEATFLWYTGDCESQQTIIPGDRVFAGTRILTPSFEVEVLASGSDRLLSKLSQKTERATPMHWADRIAGRMVWFIMFLAVLTAVFWAVYPPLPIWSHVINNSLTVLLAACPCVLGLAMPLAHAIAQKRWRTRDIWLASNHENIFERLSRIDTVVLDYTGTLTEGIEVTWDSGLLPENDLKACIRALEHGQWHPLAQPLLAYATDSGTTDPFLNIRPCRGGLVGEDLQGNSWSIGDGRILSEPSFSQNAQLYITKNAQCVASYRLRAPLKEHAFKLIHSLQALGLHVKIFSGSLVPPDPRLQSLLGSEAVVFGLLPEQKKIRIQELGGNVMMLGDGLNDQPAMQEASISVGVARNASVHHGGFCPDFLLSGDNLLQLVDILQEGRRTFTIMRQNLIWALLYNSIALASATGFFFSLLGCCTLNPMLACAMMLGSSLVVIWNARRLETSSEAIQKAEVRSEVDVHPLPQTWTAFSTQTERRNFHDFQNVRDLVQKSTSPEEKAMKFSRLRIEKGPQP